MPQRCCRLQHSEPQHPGHALLCQWAGPLDRRIAPQRHGPGSQGAKVSSHCCLMRQQLASLPCRTGQGPLCAPPPAAEPGLAQDHQELPLLCIKQQHWRGAKPAWCCRGWQQFWLLACCPQYLGPSRAYLNMAQTGDMTWVPDLASLQAGQPDKILVTAYLSRAFRGQQTRRASPWANVPVMPAGLHVKPAALLVTGASASFCS